MKKRFILVVCLLSIFAAKAQTYTNAQLKTDLNFLIDGIKTYNPALYKFNSDFDANASELMNQLPEEADQFEHLSIVSKLVAFANEGHFGVGYWKDDVHGGILSGTYKYLPVNVKVLKGRVFSWGDLSNDPKLERGDELLSINGDGISKIVTQLKSHLQSDGDIETSMEQSLNNVFASFYYLLIDQPQEFNLRVKSSEGVEKQVVLQAISRYQMVKNAQLLRADLPTNTDSASHEIFDFEIIDQVAKLKLKTFNKGKLENAKMKAKSFYNSIFSELQANEVKVLILDLRDNSGGRNEFSDDILPFILDEDKKGICKKTLSWKGNEKVYKIPKKRKQAFDGSIYVIINGNTFSAASVLAHNLREYHDQTFIVGEESGTRYEGFAAGSSQMIYLPVSNLRINIPRYLISFPESKVQQTNNRGVIPDFPIEYTIEDLIEKRDKALVFVEKLEREYLNGN